MTPKEKEAFDAMRHALEYHIEQTRPIQGSINALAAAKNAAGEVPVVETPRFTGTISLGPVLAPDPRIAALEAKVRDYEAALNSIASWNDGPIVANFFDEPSAASEAREVLAKHGGTA